MGGRAAGCSCDLGVAGGDAALGEILLMVFLGAIKRTGGFHFCDDGALENVGIFEGGDGFARGGFLFGIVNENRGAILRTEVGALAVERGGIVILKNAARSSR